MSWLAPTAISLMTEPLLLLSITVILTLESYHLYMQLSIFFLKLIALDLA